MPNDPETQYMRGISYLHGDGGKKDEKKAAELFEKAADLGHTPAKRELGLLYLNGIGVKEDAKKAYVLLSEASLALDPNAIYSLGLMYEKGIGMEPNDREALRLFALAANLHYPGAGDDADRIEKKLKDDLCRRLRSRPVLKLEISDVEIEAVCCKDMLDAAMDGSIAVVDTFKGPELVGEDEDGFETIYTKCPFCGKEVHRVPRNKEY